MERSHGLTFLFSDRGPLPDRFFQGFALIGHDYVFGEAGAAQYEASTGRPIIAGEDGCYVTVVRSGGDYHVGTDHSGLKKLFYYHHGDAWCVSNSLVVLVEHLRRRGLELTVNFPQLTAFKASGTFASQQSTAATIFNEIRLLPTTHALTISQTGIRPTPRTKRDPVAYNDGLTQYVTIWRARIQTLLRDSRIWLNADLSGGRDSRTVFALLESAADGNRGSKIPAGIRIRSSTSSQFAADLAVAQTITKHYGWQLNGSMEGRPPLARFSDEERYTGWRDLSLGLYLPIYFPDRRPNPWVIDLHGGGGENHRPFYRGDNLSAELGSSRYLRPAYLAEAWRQDVLRAEEQLAQAWPSIPTPVAHYREFRNRFHGGLMAQYRSVLTPLGGKHLDLLSEHTSKVSTGQIHFDLMESLAAGLKDLPFDGQAKSPTRENMANLTVIAPPETATSGKIYGLEGAGHPDVTRTPDGHLQRLESEFDSSSRNRLVQEFLGQELISSARNAIEQALPARQFAHSADAKDVSRTLTANFAFVSSGMN